MFAVCSCLKTKQDRTEQNTKGQHKKATQSKKQERARGQKRRVACSRERQWRRISPVHCRRTDCTGRSTPMIKVTGLVQGFDQRIRAAGSNAMLARKRTQSEARRTPDTHERHREQKHSYECTYHHTPRCVSINGQSRTQCYDDM